MVGSAFGGVMGHAFQLGVHGLMVAGHWGSYKQKTSEGQNPAFAAAVEGVQMAAGFLLPMPAQMALFGIPITRAVTSAVISAAKQHNTFVRQAKTPFSHRFEHTDVTARAQAMGLRAIGAAWGHANMGSEAAMMARRYGR